MPTAVLESPTSVPLPPSMRKVWTQAECEAHAAADPAQWEHLELIEGQLINTMSKGSFHFVTLCLPRNWLTSAFGGLSVGQEPSIDVSPADNPTSEPEPDLIVTASEVTAYARRKPGPRDIRLLVEVADSSLRFDLSTKARLYARAEIVEYWVADVHNLRLHVHRDPSGGEYRSILIYSADETVSPLAAPQAVLQVADAFPKDSGSAL